VSRARSADAEVVITGVGMVTSVGHRAWPAAAAMLARVQRFVEIDELLDREGEPIAAAQVSRFAEEDQPALAMALAAAAEAMGQSFPDAEEALERLRAWVSIDTGPLAGDGGAPPLGVSPWDRLRLAVPGLRVEPDSQLPTGHHAAGLLGLRAAVDRLRAGRADVCLVGGVDSLVAAVAALDADERLKTSYAPYGVTPGEAAAFVVLERAADAGARGGRALAVVRASGDASGPPWSWPPRQDGGQALCAALEAATRGANALRDRMTVVCDLNGEPHRSAEWGLGRSRVLRFAREIDLFHPADAVGEVGAATGALLLGFATFLLNRLFSPASDALVWTSSDDGPRAAVHLTRAPHPPV
jgi:3-oxoacyl-[acyl-carrier-protein] synthase-1